MHGCHVSKTWEYKEHLNGGVACCRLWVSLLGWEPGFSLWWLIYWQERDNNLCREIGTSCNSSDWNTACWPKGEVMVKCGREKKSLDLPWVKSSEASGNTGDYPTSKNSENSSSLIRPSRIGKNIRLLQADCQCGTCRVHLGCRPWASILQWDLFRSF